MKVTRDLYKIGLILGWLSIVINLVLFFFKLRIGIKIDSIALKADAWHTLSDSLTSLMMVAGFIIAKRPPDEDHPFGHERAEKISSILIGFMLILVGLNFFKGSISRLINNVTVNFNFASIIVQVSCAIIKQMLSFTSFYYSKKLSLTSLKADAWHHQSDAITSYLFLIGVGLSGIIRAVDAYLGILISIAILWTAIDIMRHSISPLLGENVSEELKKKVYDEVSKVDSRISNIHHFHMHRYGSHVEITFHIRLPKDITLEEAHNITNQIEKNLIKYNLHATVHIEPYENK
ncbi:MAG: cation diffusion facilitator family transporter [candidate division WOR-3 bacterium]